MSVTHAPTRSDLLRHAADDARGLVLLTHLQADVPTSVQRVNLVRAGLACAAVAEDLADRIATNEADARLQQENCRAWSELASEFLASAAELPLH